MSGSRAENPETSTRTVNLPTGDRRPTGVTATLSESAILLEIAPADEALAPDTFATSAFDAEEQRQPAVWAAADVVTEIYHGHYHSLVRLAVLLVHDVQTAEEVVQDAFEAMHLASRRLRDSEKALQYLRQTVVNRSRSVLRHRKVVDMHAPKPGAGRAERRARRARDPRALGGRGGAARAARAAARGHRPALLRGLLRGRHRQGDGDQQGRGEEPHGPRDGVAQDDADPGDVMTRPTRADW